MRETIFPRGERLIRDFFGLSYFLSGNKDIYAKIQAAINGGKRICITWINAYEIFKGLRLKNFCRKEEMFKNFLKVIDIYGSDEVSIIVAANIYAELRRTGQPIGDADILIAAVVIANKGILVTILVISVLVISVLVISY